ncbi:MAG: hypothetical protein AABX11_06260 [Nanoarchaeota archaeon]
MLIHKEKIKSDFKGTIIDIETIGNFSNFPDSRRYKEIVPVIFGFINNEELTIFCAKEKDSIETLKKQILDTLKNLEKPFYTFNSVFEKGVLFHHLGNEIEFKHELNKEKYESKLSAVRDLKISNYDDPFNDTGKLCMQAWLNGKVKEAIAHNRSCLLKEKDILLKRGFRKPDELNLVKLK